MKKNILTSAFILILLTLVRCSSSNEEVKEAPTPNLNIDNATLKVGEEIVATSDIAVTWHVEDPFVAYINNGTIKGRHVGETKAIARTIDGKESYINVIINHSVKTTYREPYITWGESLDMIWNILSSDGWSRGVYGDQYMYIFDNNNMNGGLRNYAYITNQDKLFDTVIVDFIYFDFNESDGTDGYKWMGEKYELIKYKGNEYYSDALSYDDARLLIYKRIYDSDGAKGFMLYYRSGELQRLIDNQ